MTDCFTKARIPDEREVTGGAGDLCNKNAWRLLMFN